MEFPNFEGYLSRQDPPYTPLTHEDTTYVLGWWDIRGNNKTGGFKYYAGQLERTLMMLKDRKIVFFYDNDECLSAFKKAVQTKTYEVIHLPAEQLPAYEDAERRTDNLNIDTYVEDIIEARDNYAKQQDASFKLNPRDLGLGFPFHAKGFTMDVAVAKEHGLKWDSATQEAVTKLYAVWDSKVFLVDQVRVFNPFATNYFAWMDISFCRLNRFIWNVYPHDKEHITTYPPFTTSPSDQGRMYNVNGAFLFGYKDLWPRVCKLMRKVMRDTEGENYLYMDEAKYRRIQGKEDIFSNVFDELFETGKKGYSYRGAKPSIRNTYDPEEARRKAWNKSKAHPPEKNVLYVGSGNSAEFIKDIDLSQYTVVCVNNAWRLFVDKQIYAWVRPGDFPRENYPRTKGYDVEVRPLEYNKAAEDAMKKLNHEWKSPSHAYGYTIFFNGLYWIMMTLKPKRISLLGFDHDYNPEKVARWEEGKRPNPQNRYQAKGDVDVDEWGNTFFKGLKQDSFYGQGTPDPLRLGESHLVEKFNFALENCSRLGIDLVNLSPVPSRINSAPKDLSWQNKTN